MEELVKVFTELGVLVGIIVSGGFGGFLILRWLGNYLLRPGIESAINYLNGQTEATRKNVELLESLRVVETDIYKAIEEVKNSQNDPDSNYSTIHTNQSIILLARAVGRIAKHLDVDIDSFLQEIEITLRKK